MGLQEVLVQVEVLVHQDQVEVLEQQDLLVSEVRLFKLTSGEFWMKLKLLGS